MSQPSNVRFTVLTDRLIRCEWQPEGRFEDGRTQWVMSRAFPPADFKRSDQDGVTTIHTAALTLTYRHAARSFHRGNLNVTMKSGAVWAFGDANKDHLGGTARTLDECDGPVNRREARHIEEHPGIFSRSGWAVLDDSASMILNDANLPEDRPVDRVQDIYFFAYGSDFATGLRDFYTLTGRPPLLPSWALGLWWSRWEKYNADDLLRIVGEFEAHRLPLSVLVIDMDWHIIENEYHGGWTGYTWNRAFFPDPEGFFKQIHAKGIRACLNLHPAKGCYPHEDAYEAFATFMGMDPASKQPVLFNPADPKFLEGYFKFLHHPHEAIGVDFWWIDWQQGKKTPFSDVDPLWVLNHLHSADLARDGQRRPFTFSRWCGAGAHRYPVGFSGDTYRTWRSLRYQVEFTARAANLGFGWWSHDIGAFARGMHDDELYVRWVQYGCFSPVFRLHNAGDPSVDHRPWSKEQRFSKPAIAAMQLRRALQPYIYTCARENADGGFPLVRPMYFHHGDDPEAYQWPGQYYFGPRLLVAPVTHARHPETNLASQPVWLPAGDWCEFRSGIMYAGGRVHGLHAGLDDIPVFARAGSIIPMLEQDGKRLEIICFAGDEGEGELYIDDGSTLAYEQGAYARIRFSQRMRDGQWLFTMEQIEGALEPGLSVTLILRGYESLNAAEIIINGEPANCDASRIGNETDTYLPVGTVPQRGLRITSSIAATRRRKPAPHRDGLNALLQKMTMNCHFARPLIDHWEKTSSDPASLARFMPDLTDQQLRVMVDYLFDAGFAVMTVSETCRHLAWWNSSRFNMSWRFDLRQEYIWESTTSPAGQSFGTRTFACWSTFLAWRIQVDLLGAAMVVEREYDARDLYGEGPAGRRLNA